MALAAMMGLVIEEMREGRAERLGDRLRYADRRIGKFAAKVLIGRGGDKGSDSVIEFRPRGAKFGEIRIGDFIEPVICLALTGETMHPDSVRNDEMVQRVMQ